MNYLQTNNYFKDKKYFYFEKKEIFTLQKIDGLEVNFKLYAFGYHKEQIISSNPQQLWYKIIYNFYTKFSFLIHNGIC